MPLTHFSSQNVLFCYSDIFSQCFIDVTIQYEKDYSGRIVNHSFELGNIRIVNLPLQEAVQKNWKSERMAKMMGNDFYHDLLFAIVDVRSGNELVESSYTNLKGKTTFWEERKEWYTNKGRNRLGSFLGKCNMTAAEKSKIQAYIKAESIHYRALIGVTHQLSWFIQRLNNVATLNKMLKKQARWF